MGGMFGGDAETIDLEQEGFEREYHDAQDPDNDYGAFVPADAYMLISGKHDADYSELATIDPDRPNLTGRDYVQAPLMALTMEHDPGTAGDTYFNPVTEAYGINDYSSYGAAITGANHITPISHFMASPSWGLPEQLADWLLSVENITTILYDLFIANDDEIEDIFESILCRQTVKSEELLRMEEIRLMSVNFWDVDAGLEV